MIDTHSHLYLEEFDNDRAEAVQRAIDAGVKHIILPNVDANSVNSMLNMMNDYPGYVDAAMGLHPTSVTADNAEFLKFVDSELATGKYIAVGEVGLDLYWDTTYLSEQIDVFMRQIDMANHYHLPVIVHTRNAMSQLIDSLSAYGDTLPCMIFHSFTGTAAEANAILSLEGNSRFFFGINGIVTFKNSNMEEMLHFVGTERVLLETDCPYLAPVPYRGKRNESAFVAKVRDKLADIFTLSSEEIDRITTANTLMAFPKLNL
ncbi:MAG: TatD family hydrolase [Muribaculaceae bacterium]|nr:TatD family hydrolase [Muribaculaceae bacterium]